MAHPIPASFVLPALLVTLAVAPLAAQAAPAPAPLDLAALRAPFRGKQLEEPRADGVFWARGEGYKARIGAEGLTFFPLFGPSTPRHLPLGLRLRSVAGQPAVEAAPRRNGDTVELQHGDVTERFEVRPDGVEHSFLVPAPVGAALEVRMAVTTELVPVRAERELRFAAPGLGHVAYGEGVAIDAAGDRATLVPSWDEDAREIGLRVPDEFLARARWPVVIDPLVAAYSANPAAASLRNADVAWCSSARTWVVVMEDRVTASDIDVRAIRLDQDGAELDNLLLDATADSCINPRIAAHSGLSQFLAVWDNETANRIEGRTRSATTTTLGSLRSIADAPLGGDARDPDVGGLSSAADTQYLVVYQRRSIAGNDSLRGVPMSTAGGPGAEFIIESQPQCTPKPRICKDAGPGRAWAIVWQQTNTACASQVSVHYAVWSTALNEIMPPTVLSTSAGPFAPAVSGDGNKFLTVFLRPETGNGTDVIAIELLRNTSGVFLGAGYNVNLLERTNPNRTLNQTAPAVATDGCRAVVAYLEPRNGVVHPFVSSFLQDTTFVFEPHLDASPASSRIHARPAIAAADNVPGAALRHLIVWDEDLGTGTFDVRGTFYDAHTGTGGVQAVATGCGALDTNHNGVAAIGRTLDVSLNSTGTPLFLLGLPTPPVTVCGARPTRCALGVLPILQVFATQRFTAPIPCDRSLLGSTLALQGVDIGATGGCGAGTTGVPLVMGDTLVIQFQ
jgi:hypothetical protein